MAIQEREDDLVVGTFGRGFYILDDYSPLRHVDEATESKGGFLFPVADALQFRNTIGSRGSQGTGNYVAPNPPYGAVFTIFLKPEAVSSTDEGEGAYIIIVRNEAGTEVNRVPVRSKSGLQRIAWDLRERPPEAEEGRRRGRGQEVTPGTFTATLIWDTGGRVAYYIGDPRTFRVRALEILR